MIKEPEASGSFCMAMKGSYNITFSTPVLTDTGL